MQRPPPVPQDHGVVLIALPNERATLRDMRELPLHAFWDAGRELAAGSVTAVRAAARLLVGIWSEPACITANGRLDGHGSFVLGPGTSGGGVCAYCKKPVGG